MFDPGPCVYMEKLAGSREIADLLYISISTVETHRNNIFQKLNLHNLAELILYAVRKGLIS